MCSVMGHTRQYWAAPDLVAAEPVHLRNSFQASPFLWGRRREQAPRQGCVLRVASGCPHSQGGSAFAAKRSRT